MQAGPFASHDTGSKCRRKINNLPSQDGVHGKPCVDDGLKRLWPSQEMIIVSTAPCRCHGRCKCSQGGSIDRIVGQWVVQERRPGNRILNETQNASRLGTTTCEQPSPSCSDDARPGPGSRKLTAPTMLRRQLQSRSDQQGGDEHGSRSRHARAPCRMRQQRTTSSLHEFAQVSLEWVAAPPRDRHHGRLRCLDGRLRCQDPPYGGKAKMATDSVLGIHTHMNMTHT